MKTVWIHASPHERGNSAALAEAFLKPLGGDVTRFDAYTAGILPCVDCGLCTRCAHCSREDHATELLHEIDEADVLVLSSPVYFSDLPGPLVSMASRLQYIWMRRQANENPLSIKKRHGVILLTGGGSGKPDRAIAAAKCYLHMLGCDIAGVVTSLHTDRLPLREDEEAQALAATLARQIQNDLP